MWQIVAPPGHRVYVIVRALQLQAGQDPLSFGWGDTFENKTTQIGPKLTGGDNPLVAFASRNALMWVVLKTNSYGASSGFSFHVHQPSKTDLIWYALYRACGLVKFSSEQP